MSSNGGITSDSYERTLVSNTLVAAVVFLCYFFTSYRIGENAQTVGVLALLIVLLARPNVTISPWPWLVVFVSLLYSLIERPLDVPNHHYMMTYLSLALVLIFTAPRAEQLSVMSCNVRWMLVVLMAFATVQKLLSPTFLDSSYLSYELVRGGFGDPVLPLFGNVAEISAENDRLIEEFRNQPPELVASVQLEPPFANLGIVAWVFALTILGIELWLCIGFMAFPGWLLSHLSLLAFIITLGVLRQEFTFISVVSAMGAMACGENRPLVRYTYIALAVFCAAAVLKTLN